MKKLVLALLMVFAVALSACGYEESAVRKDSATTNETMNQLLINQPTPKFTYSQDRDILIQIYKLKNEARLTYASIDSMTGVHISNCPSLGYPIPADTQLTNPLQLSSPSYSTSSVVEQAEPNGIYTSKNTDGTYVMCVRANGDIAPVYTEQKVTVWPYAVIRQADGSWVEDVKAPSTIKITVKK